MKMSSEENQQPSELSLRMSGLVIQDNNPNQREKNTDQENRRDNHETHLVGAVFKQICSNFIRDINNFGISVLDNFLGPERGNLVFEEVLKLENSGLFQEGQLVKNNEKNNRIRGDLTAWLSRSDEERYPNIRKLIKEIDNIVMTAGKIPNNGKLGKYEIKERTKVSNVANFFYQFLLAQNKIAELLFLCFIFCCAGYGRLLSWQRNALR